jgi:hypothetical protein
MKRNVILAIAVITNTIVGVAMAAEVPSKKPDPVGAPLGGAASAVPRAERVEAKAKGSEPLKWDQLDPKAVERAAKKAQSKSPFSAVPAER